MSFHRSPEEYVMVADKKLKAFSLFSKKDYDEISELYEKAANQYKLKKDLTNAASCYIKSAECQIKENHLWSAASKYDLAAACYKNDKLLVIQCLEKSIDLYLAEGKFRDVAKHYKDIAEYYSELDDLQNTIKSYKLAIEFFLGENSESDATTCQLKLAECYIVLSEYQEAFKLYEEAGKRYVNNDLLKFRAGEQFYFAILCCLALDDIVSAKKQYELFCDVLLPFESSPDGKFVSYLIFAIEKYDIDKFTESIKERDIIKKLNKLEVTLLSKAKKSIKTDIGETDNDDLA